jgi:hypothetical protein
MDFKSVSSNTLFHFTPKLEYLIDILKNDFRPRFCHEILEDTLASPPDSWWNRAIPMTCFCDLTLSNTAQHLNTYGQYGIGMTKEWGKKMGLTPILYIHSNSPLVECVRTSITALSHSVIGAHCEDDQEVFLRLSGGLEDLINFVKPYTGSFDRNGSIIPDVRFYDEREWRYVPTQAEVLSKPEYDRRKADGLLGYGKAPLVFEPKDIRYIIVKNESEILTMYDRIAAEKGSKYSYDDVRLLQSRLISATQIREDF